MVRSRLIVAISFGILIVAPFRTAVAGAQEEAARKSLAAARRTSPVELDGALTEGAWQAAQPIADFVQQEPHIGEPSTERTEVRVLFDEEGIYFGVTCSDSRPGGVLARELRRDNSFSNDDRFEIVLDTYHDHRNAFHFVINPLGTQYDALITDEGQDVNREWDERWYSETRIDSSGWTAEIMIPFTTLRSREGVETWGVNFQRTIRSKDEFVYWTSWDRDFTFAQVSQAGHLTGLSGVHTGLKLRIKPYGLGGFKETPVGRDLETDSINDVGIEVMKFSLTTGLTAEVTVNTDFAQTEVDDAVVNLTRFPVFFPEKREFFLEGAGTFEFGLGGRRGGEVERNLHMYFSRRIGLTDDRREVPIIAGAKLIGRLVGSDIGFLNIQTDDFEGTPANNYTVLRAKRNILSRSNVGIFASNRQSSGSDYNRVFGGEANFTVLKNTDIKGFLSRSFTSTREGNSWAGRAKYNWFSDIHEAFLEQLYIGDQFQHDIGFLQRRGIQRTNAIYVWEPRPDRFNIRNFVFRNELVYLTNLDRHLLQRDQIFQATARFNNDDAMRFNTLYRFDRLEAPFEIASGIVLPPGDYNFRDYFFEQEGSPKRVLSGRVRVGGGDFYSGTRTYVTLTPSFKPIQYLSLEPSYEFNDVSLKEGDFTTHVLNARLNVNLSNRWLTTTLVQYDSASRRNTVFFRLNYIYRPGDDLFVVFNRSEEDIGPRRGLPDTAFMVKLTRSFDF
jgi:hypothetical protein